METSGPRDEVVKLMPPLTIEEDVLKQGLERMEAAIRDLHDRIEQTNLMEAGR
ncbi:diaminobutyrate--2-oxoglutarate aminotransferase [compost metagenome]